MSFDFVENFTVMLPDFSQSEMDFSESTFNSKHGLIIEVAAIHEGLTSNYNNYSALELEKALQSWVEPYPKPIILNHDLSTEPIGRVIAAKMDKETDGTAFVRLQIAITDPTAVEKVRDQRYLTGSVGGRAGKAVCSISGEDLAQEDANGRPRVPKYKRGKVYKGKIAFIDMQDISFHEYSFVNQPADGKSGVRSAKPIDGSAPIANSDQWVARSSAFILHMDSEDIIAVQGNESILKNMKKKESKPTYLHLKGAFLSALALQESESDIQHTDSLLSSEDSENLNPEENHNMGEVNKDDEDILAVATGLSEDLSNIAAAATTAEESEEDSTEESAIEEEVVSEEADQDSVAAEENSTDDSEEADVQENVDSENAEKPEESSTSTDEVDAVQEEEEQHDDLTTENASHERDVELLNEKVRLLEEENARLKNALHITLVERVVDTKIGLGYESIEDREKLITEHVTRTASSLADSLRDLAKLPIKKVAAVTHGSVPEVTSEAVADEDAEIVAEETKPKESDLEMIFVDALMGRRKL